MGKSTVSFLLFILFTGCFTFGISAQEYSYDISKYYTPDIVRSRLDLNFNSDGSISNSKRINDPLYSNFNDSSSTTNLNGELIPTFETYTNTRKRLSLFQLDGRLNFNSKSIVPGNDIYLQKNNNSTEYLNINYNSKFYNSSNQFFSVGIGSSIDANKRNDNLGNDSIFSNSTNNSFRLGISPSIGFGFGRIESVEDARQAIYIIDALSKKGVLTRHLTDDEIFILAQQISRVKNKRFLDSRLHLMDEIASVDSFFVNKNLLNKSDASYFTNLYDNWLYAANFERKSGQVFEIRFTPQLNLNNDKSSNITPGTNTWSKNEYVNYGGNLLFSYSYEKPVNLNWQHSVGATLSGYSYLQNRVNSDETNQLEARDTINNSGINLTGNYTLGYYPSTRTHLSVGISQLFQADYSKNMNIGIYDSNSWYKNFISSTNLSLSAYYYLSPQLSLSGSASLNKLYQNNVGVTTNQLNGAFTAGIKYSFF